MPRSQALVHLSCSSGRTAAGAAPRNVVLLALGGRTQPTHATIVPGSDGQRQSFHGRTKDKHEQAPVTMIAMEEETKEANALRQHDETPGENGLLYHRRSMRVVEFLNQGGSVPIR